MRRAQLWRVAWVAVAEVCTHRGKDYRGWRVDLFSGGQAWYEQKLSPDSQTTQHQHKFGPLNCQTRSQVVNVLTRVSSSPLGHCKTETTRAFQSSAQTTDYWSDKAGLLYWWEAFLSQSSSEQSEWSRLGERKEEERLLIERAKFAPHMMEFAVAARVNFTLSTKRPKWTPVITPPSSCQITGSAVALHCVKAHRQSQWRSPNFNPL